MEAKTHYQINVCGGDFQHVKDCFSAWKGQTLIYRKDQRMFDGKNEVRLLSDQIFDNGERARNALEQTCTPQDSYALAAQVDDGERAIWLVMAAYQE
jgi:hypothetical protein